MFQLKPWPEKDKGIGTFKDYCALKQNVDFWMHAKDIPALLERFIIVEVVVKNVPFCSRTLSFCIQYET